MPITGAGASSGTGTPGPRGESAYQVWLDNGHTGSAADFLASLVGPEGPAGHDGQDGAGGTGSSPANTVLDGGTWDPAVTYPPHSLVAYENSAYLAAVESTGVAPVTVSETSYSSTVLADAPYAFWRLNDPTGATTLVDATGNGRSLTGSNFQCVTGLTSEAGSLAMGFSGTVEYGVEDAATSADLAVKLIAGATIEGLVRIDSFVVGDVWLGAQYNLGVPAGRHQGGLGLRVNHTNRKLEFCLIDGSGADAGQGYRWYSGGTALALGSVYHVAGTYDGSTIKLYVNGNLDGSYTGVTPPPAATDTQFTIGTTPDDRTAEWTGALDEVAIWTSALTGAQIAAHDAARVESAVSTVAAEWRLLTGAAAGSTPSTPALSTAVANYAPLRSWYSALAGRRFDHATVMVVGDSISEADGASTVSAGFVARLGENLRARYGGTGNGFGYLAARYAAVPAMCPLTSTGAALDRSYGPGGRAVQLTAGQRLSGTVTGTSVRVLYARSSGTFTVTVDGGSSVTVDSSSGVTDGNVSAAVSLGAAGAHSVSVTGATGTVIIDGLLVFNGDESAGVRVLECAHGGNTAQNYVDDANYPSWVTAFAPSLVVFHLGTNEAYQNVTPATLQANLTTLFGRTRAAVSPAPALCVVIPPASGENGTTPWSQYADAIRAAATADGHVAVFDLEARMGDDTPASGLMTSDNVHPNDRGHAFIADALAGFLEAR